MNWNDKKAYWISRFIISILVLIVLKIIFRNSNESWSDIPYIVTIFTFLISFPTTIASRKFINAGNAFNTTGKKLFYYLFVFPCAIFGIFVAISTLVSMIFFVFDSLDVALLIDLIALISCIVIYMQTIIVLTIYHFTNNKII